MFICIQELWRRYREGQSPVRRKRSRDSHFYAEFLEQRTLPAATVLVSPLSSPFTTESGGSASFLVVLSEAPAGRSRSVTIPIQSTNTSEGRVSTEQLVFTSSNWNIPRVVTVTGVDDLADDGDRSYQIELGKVKTRARNFRRANPADPSLLNLDDDGLAPGVVFSPTQFILDDASSRTVSVRLNTKPVADVTLELTIPEGDDQAQVSIKTLTFTSRNWNVAQNITIGAFMDERHDGDQPFELLANISSQDPRYDDLPDQVFKAIIHDVDPLTASLTGTYLGEFSGTKTVAGEPVTVNESLNFSILTNAIEATLPLTGTGTVSGDRVAFTLADGTAFEGSAVENADGSITISGTWESFENGISTGTGTWLAEDLAHVPYGLKITPRNAVVINEGESQQYGISLTSPPTEDVTVTFAITTGAGEATLSTTSFTFTPQNWSTPQLLTVAGVAGDGLDGDQEFEFEATTQSVDLHFDNLTPVTLTALILDTEPPQLDLNGKYTGIYTGNVTIFGTTTAVDGDVEFTVTDGVVAVTKPATASGTIDGDKISFAPTTGNLAGARFAGTFKDNGDGTITASGTWSVSRAGATGSGTWTATRPAS